MGALPAGKEDEINPLRRIYLLSPRRLSPETIAVAFAKTSRSPQSFSDIAAALSEQDSTRFHERWVVGFGHASVAEHAVLHIALENISRLAIECLESNRLASYTEKSTRYQKWSPGAYHLPTEFKGSRLEGEYRAACDFLLETYQASLQATAALARERFPRQEDESEAKWDGRIRSRYADVCRYLLPAACLANVGVTINARALEHALRKMLSHPLVEVREIGMEIREAAQQETPTLLKYSEASPYLQRLAAKIEARPLNRAPSEALPLSGLVRLIQYDPEAEDRVLAAAWVRSSGIPYRQALADIAALPPAKRGELASALLGSMSPRDVPARELEHLSYLFEAVLDQGAYFEVKRHRMMTQTPAPLTSDLGYVTPVWFEQAGVLGRFREAMDRAAQAYRDLVQLDERAASYVIPNAFRRRVILTLNLREAFHFCELRSGENAHFAVRLIALQMADQIRQVHPLLSAYMRLAGRPSWQEIETSYFG